MKDPYLEVTFRKGKPLAAYLSLPRLPSEKSVRTERRSPGIQVDFGARGVAIGIELTAPAQVSLDELNAVLAELGFAKVSSQDLAPLHAA